MSALTEVAHGCEVLLGQGELEHLVTRRDGGVEGENSSRLDLFLRHLERGPSFTPTEILSKRLMAAWPLVDMPHHRLDRLNCERADCTHPSTSSWQNRISAPGCRGGG